MDPEFEDFLRDIKSINLPHRNNTFPVSGIIATYNRCPFERIEQRMNPLALCLDSILSQTIKLGELIIIDDASSDNTVYPQTNILVNGWLS